MLAQEVATIEARIPTYGQMKPLHDRVASNPNKPSAFRLIADWKHCSDRAKRLRGNSKLAILVELGHQGRRKRLMACARF